MAKAGGETPPGLAGWKPALRLVSGMQVRSLFPWDVWVERQFHDEPAPVTRLALHADVALVSFDYMFDDAEPDADAGRFAPQFGAAPVKWFEDAFAIGGGDAWPLVLNPEPERTGSRRDRAGMDGGGPFESDGYRMVRGRVFDGVVDEVYEGLLQGFGVHFGERPAINGRIRRDLADQINLAIGGQRREHSHRVPNQGGRIGGFEFVLFAALINA